MSHKAFLLVFLGLLGAAQEAPVSRVVTIPLVASGPHHRPTSVTVESLVVTDQKTPVTGARLLHGTDLPIELGILIDVSNSQRDAHLDDTVKVMRQSVDEIIRGPEDHAFFVTFDAAPHATGWLKKEDLQGANFNVRIGGATAFYDAIVMACRQRMGPRDWRKPTRRILVVISDGEDNQSHVTRGEAAAEAVKAGVVLFAIDPANSGTSNRGGGIMENFAKVTGGESFSPVGTSETRKAFARIQELIESVYYLTYVPPDASKGAVHEVEVKPSPKGNFKLSYPKKYLWSP